MADLGRKLGNVQSISAHFSLTPDGWFPTVPSSFIEHCCMSCPELVLGGQREKKAQLLNTKSSKGRQT